MNFTNKRIIVTGATRGIGLATAKAFLNAGANVAMILFGWLMEVANRPGEPVWWTSRKRASSARIWRAASD